MYCWTPGANDTETNTYDLQNKITNADGAKVLIPFLVGFKTGLHAACFSFIAGVMSPMAMAGDIDETTIYGKPYVVWRY